MGAVVPFIPQIIGGASALFGSLKGNKASNRSSTQTQQSHRTGQTQGILTEGQQALEDSILGNLLNWISNGPQVMQARKNELFGQINAAHNAAIPRLQADFSSRGMGQSGAFGQALRDNEFARAKDRGTGMASLQSQAMNDWMNMIGLGQRALTPRTINTTEDLTGTSTGTGPSDIGNIIGGSGFALAQFLKNILNRPNANLTSPGLFELPGLGGVPEPGANPYGPLGN